MKDEKPVFSMPKGLLSMYILKILEKPRHGYEILKEVECGGCDWKPSPGSIYPILQGLKERGLIKEKKVGRRKVYVVSARGREKLRMVKKFREDMRERMWTMSRLIAGITGDEEMLEGFHMMREMFKAVHEDPRKTRKVGELMEKFAKEMKEICGI